MSYSDPARPKLEENFCWLFLQFEQIIFDNLLQLLLNLWFMYLFLWYRCVALVTSVHIRTTLNRIILKFSVKINLFIWDFLYWNLMSQWSVLLLIVGIVLFREGYCWLGNLCASLCNLRLIRPEYLEKYKSTCIRIISPLDWVESSWWKV